MALLKKCKIYLYKNSNNSNGIFYRSLILKNRTTLSKTIEEKPLFCKNILNAFERLSSTKTTDKDKKTTDNDKQATNKQKKTNDKINCDEKSKKVAAEPKLTTKKPPPCCNASYDMDALQYNAKDKSLKFGKIPKPKVTDPDEVLVKVHYAGVCGTDIHVIHSNFPCYDKGPITLGHEISGEVNFIGSNVKHVKVGDAVAVDPHNHGCGVCHTCREINPLFCPTGFKKIIGFFKNGGWAEYCLVKKQNVYKLPSTVPMDFATLIESVSCIMHGIEQVGKIPRNKKILILGAGTAGNIYSSLFHLFGYRDVTVSEPKQNRLEIAQWLKLGFELIKPYELNSRHKADENYLFDIIVESSGNAEAIETAINLLAPMGKLIIYGITPPKSAIKVSPDIFFYKELTVVGAYLNHGCFGKAVTLVDIMGDRYFEYRKMGIKVYALKDYQKGFEDLKSGKCTKLLFKVY